MSNTVASQVATLQNNINTVDEKVDDEQERATLAEAALDTKIDELKVNDLADVNVSGASDRQVLSFDSAAQEFIARTIVLSSALEYKGDIDVTQTAPGNPANGDLFVNTAQSGAVDASFGSELQAALPSVSGGEFIAFNGSEFQLIGSIGGGLTFQSFSAVNVSDASGNGSLAYNQDNGVFTFTPADLDSRIPTNLSNLASLPAG